MRRWVYPIIVIASLIYMFACASGLKIQFQQPAKQQLSGIKRIVFAPGTGADEVTMIINSISSLMSQESYFQLFDRNKFSVALEQNHLTYEVLQQPDSVRQIGKFLSVDGIIFCELKKLELLADEQGVEKVQKSVWTGEYERDQLGNIIEEKSSTGEPVKKKKFKLQPVEQHYRFRKARIEASFQLIDLKKGLLVLSKEVNENYTSDKIIKEESHKIPTDEEIKSELILKVAQVFMREIAPRTIFVRRPIEKGIALIDSGVVYARSGQWDKAQTVWDQAQKLHPTDARVYYNLGLGCEAQGDFESAEIYYKKASLLNPKKKLYQKAGQNIRQMWQKQ